MKRTLLFILVLLTISTSEINAKRKCLPYLYSFGVSISLKDSTIYMTDIQKIDSIWVEEKNGFVINRDDYSYQLRNYFDNHGMQNRVNIIVFGKNEKIIGKKYLALQKRYNNPKKHYIVDYISNDEFAFKSEAPTAQGLEQKVTTAKKNKKRKEKQ